MEEDKEKEKEIKKSENFKGWVSGLSHVKEIIRTFHSNKVDVKATQIHKPAYSFTIRTILLSGTNSNEMSFSVYWHYIYKGVLIVDYISNHDEIFRQNVDLALLSYDELVNFFNQKFSIKRNLTSVSVTYNYNDYYKIFTLPLTTEGKKLMFENRLKYGILLIPIIFIWKGTGIKNFFIGYLRNKLIMSNVKHLTS